MFNLAILTGRLTSEPELRYTANNIAVCTFGIAVDRPYRKGEEKQTDFINIVAWRERGEFVSKYFNKGSLIGIEGSIQTRKYQDKDGNNRTAFEVVANNVHFVESKKSASVDVAVDPLDDVKEKISNLGVNNTSNTLDDILDTSGDLEF